MLGRFCVPPFALASPFTSFLTDALRAGRIKPAYRRTLPIGPPEEQDRLRVPRGPAALFNMI